MPARAARAQAAPERGRKTQQAERRGGGGGGATCWAFSKLSKSAEKSCMKQHTFMWACMRCESAETRVSGSVARPHRHAVDLPLIQNLKQSVTGGGLEQEQHGRERGLQPHDTREDKPAAVCSTRSGACDLAVRPSKP